MLTRLNCFNQVTSVRNIIMGYRKPFKGKPELKKDRADRALRSKRVVELVREALENEEPNFITGKKPLYLPFATIKLLRPNAKHTPYQAKFIVPKSFNKLDLRDYLYHIYNLRTLNITSALMPGKFIRSMPAPYGGRYRQPQVKKMTVELIDPFVWPSENENFIQEKELTAQLNQYREDHANAINSDMEKPSTAFGGIIDKNPRPMNFVPKVVRRQMKNKKNNDIINTKRMEAEKFISSYINL